MTKTKLFFDTEFTGLHQNTTLISLGIVSECGKKFYAEFIDYDKSQIDDWLQENIIDKLKFTEHITASCGGWESNPRDTNEYDNALEMALRRKDADLGELYCIGKTPMIVNRLEDWLEQFDEVEMWSDCLSYDWVLFSQLWRHAFNIPKNVYYIPFDICTMFKLKHIDPDISREKYAYGDVNKEMSDNKHTALWDAVVIRDCFIKLEARSII